MIGLPTTGTRLVEAARAAGVPADRASLVADLPAAVAAARAAARPGAVVLLSPAAPSFNAYANFIARGEHFRAALAPSALLGADTPPGGVSNLSVVSNAELATVTLRDEQAPLEATFLPGGGMLCCSLRHRGEELLAQNAGVAAYVERGKTMGVPLLYPWANRLAGFDYAVAGRTVVVPRDSTRVALDGGGLPIHGVIGGRLQWELLHAPTPGAQSLAAALRWSEAHPDLFEVFPFRHDLRYEARLAGGRLEIEVQVDACGEDPVPVAFGFHPYLSPPGAPRALVGRAARRHAAPGTRRPPDPDRPRADAPRPDLRARAARVRRRGTTPSPSQPASCCRRWMPPGAHFLEGYPCAQVYAPPARHLICFEPMTAPANALRSGAGLRVLEPGESYRATFAVSVQDA